MKYMMLIYVTEDDMGEPAPGVMDAHLAVTREAIERGAYVTCDALEPTASAVRVRVRDGKIVRSDGPFAETKEIVGGFYVFDCRDLEEAVELAARIPSPPDGCIEIRRVAEIPGWDEAVAEMRAATSAAHG
ncbi:MAG: YciI family protein [Chloroflexi bacterium]|nr:YciI family protein [Chloroflexota bacterium]